MVAVAVLVPLAYRKIARKLEDAGVTKSRQRERLGYASLPRPDGKLIWCHAASVGESLSALTLINVMGERHPDAQFLLTSGTATSAQIVANRLPPRCLHQFAPLDSGSAMRRFLKHWQPDLACFIESELWPQMVVRTAAICPVALLNARISKGSLRNWGRFAQTARLLLDRFALIRTQDQATLDGILSLGAPPERCARGQNLKSAAEPLPVPQDALEALRAQLGPRPVWIAASTHAGEERVVLEAHRKLLVQTPDLMLVLVPRHPERAPDIQQMIANTGLSHSCRSRKEPPHGQVYLADTLGEMGLFYSLSPLVFLGGSLSPVGGHNPYEPAHAGAAVIHGPLYANFAEDYPALHAAGGAVEVQDDTTLAQALQHLLETPEDLQRRATAAHQFAKGQMQGLDQMISELSALLKPR
jgi:3-deoxy-D-manno-octulosonic-acid transferase